MLQKIFRASNEFWNIIYYDELISLPEFQISFLPNAKRLYFNCAHALQVSTKECLEKIERYFFERNINPAIYIDPESPKNLEVILHSRNYQEIISEKEAWYTLFPSDPGLKNINKNPHHSKNDLEFIMFFPQTNPSLLKDFLYVNGIANNLEDWLLDKLAKKMAVKKSYPFEIICAVALKNKKVISTCLLGISQKYVFLAEGATHPDFRNQGTFKHLITHCITFISSKNCEQIVVNCDKDSFSNNTLISLNFKKICERRLFQKNLYFNT